MNWLKEELKFQSVTNRDKKMTALSNSRKISTRPSIAAMKASLPARAGNSHKKQSHLSLSLKKEFSIRLAKNNRKMQNCQFHWKSQELKCGEVKFIDQRRFHLLNTYRRINLSIYWMNDFLSSDFQWIEFQLFEAMNSHRMRIGQLNLL